MSAPSPLKRREIIDALRIGAVPSRGLELFAVGMDVFETAIDEELTGVATGRGRFKAVRGEYGVFPRVQIEAVDALPDLHGQHFAEGAGVLPRAVDAGQDGAGVVFIQDNFDLGPVAMVKAPPPLLR